MKLETLLKSLVAIAAASYCLNALGYADDKKKELCRPPKIQEFTLPEYSDTNKKEATPEAEFTFVVSGWANPKKFKLSAKGVDIPFTVQSSETFHKVKAKLPASLTGKAIRINARIPALLDCYSTVGWLVKVANKKAAVVDAPKPDAATPAPTTGAEGAAAPATPKDTATPTTTPEPKAETPAPASPTTPPIAPTPPASKSNVFE